jgi:hypothetical protein
VFVRAHEHPSRRRTIARRLIEAGHTVYAAMRDTTKGTDAVVAMATIGADGPTGTFSDRDGVIAY